MNYICVDRALKDDPRVYPSGLDGFGVVITLGLLAAEKYGANGHVAPPFSSAIHVARHANTDPERAMAALTSLRAHGAIEGSQEEGWTLAEDLWTMFAGRAIAERDRKRKQRADAKKAPPLRKSGGHSAKSAPRRVTSLSVPGTDEDVQGQSGDGCPTIQPTNHPSNRHNNVGCTDIVYGEKATRPEGLAVGEPPPCGRCGFRSGGIVYRVLDGESWDNMAPEAWEAGCCPDCTTPESMTKANNPKLGLLPLPDAEGEGWRRQEETIAATMNDRAASKWFGQVRKLTAARTAKA